MEDSPKPLNNLLCSDNFVGPLTDHSDRNSTPRQ